VRIYLDLNDDGRYSADKDSTQLAGGCEVWLLNDLSTVSLPDDAKLGDPDLTGIDHRPPGADGTVIFEVPPTTVTDNCFPSPGLRTINLAPLRSRTGLVEDYLPGCCPFQDGSPKLAIAMSTSGAGLFYFQTVDVGASETKTLTVRGYPKHDHSGRQFWYLAIGLVTTWAVIAALFAWAHRRRN
jgi:hypothetical protein